MPLPMFKGDTPSGPKIRHIVGVAAGKGGVGKSTVTVNLALTLRRRGYKVGVLDTDIYGPSIRRMLPEDRLPDQKGQRLVPALCLGVKMMSMAYFRHEGKAAAVRAPIANGLVSQFLNQVEWGDLDYLLIDFPPGTGDVQLTLAQQAKLTGAVMVTTPQEVALMDVRKAMDLFDQVKVPILGILENMSFYTHPGADEPVYLFGKGGGERLARESGLPFLGQVPLDPELARACDDGYPLVLNAPDSNLAKSFGEAADQLERQVATLEAEGQGALGQFELAWEEKE